VSAPLKAAYRDRIEVLERGGVNTIGKQHFTSIYSPARERAFTPKNIKASFAANGLFPLNPNRVLKDIPKPIAELYIQKINDKQSRAYPHDEVLQMPVTPMSEEALVSLQNLISKRHTHSLDETSKQSLEKHVEKIVKIARTTLATSAIQKDQIRFLIKVNNEAKVRRSTRSTILGKAKEDAGGSRKSQQPKQKELL
jgi:hypothetical protein